eukprot:1851293-Prymnesium_polylepis.1
MSPSKRAHSCTQSRAYIRVHGKVNTRREDLTSCGGRAMVWVRLRAPWCPPAGRRRTTMRICLLAPLAGKGRSGNRSYHAFT